MRLLKALQESMRFSSTEQAVVSYLLEHPKEVEALSSKELAERTFTSSATISRLCQKLQFKGYMEFKLKFVSEVNRVSPEHERITGQPLSESDNPEEIIRKISILEIEAIEETRNEMSLGKLKKIVDWMQNAGTVDMYAYDANYSSCRLACNQLQQIGVRATMNFESNGQLVQALASNPHHLAFIVSRTGENRRLINVAKVLKKRKTPLVVFSTERYSTLSRMADEFCYVANTELFLYLGSIVFATGLKYYFDVLFGLLLSRDFDKHKVFYDSYESISRGPDDPSRLW